MRHRHPLPEAWLFTDARMGDALWRAIARLPRGSGIVFRHDDAEDRQALEAGLRAVKVELRRPENVFDSGPYEIVNAHAVKRRPAIIDVIVIRHCQAAPLVLGQHHVAQVAQHLGADGVHVKTGHGAARPAMTAAAHGRADIVRAQRAGARLVFLSPVHATRSHPDATPLGRVRFGLMLHGAGIAVAALGGMTKRRFRALKPLGARGWGAIDAWIG